MEILAMACLGGMLVLTILIYNGCKEYVAR